MIKTIAAAVGIVLFSTGVSSSAEPLAEALKKIDGVEVILDGYIGTGLVVMDDEALTFRDKNGQVFKVIMDAGRNARKSIEGCEFAMFGGGTPCAIKAVGVIERDASSIGIAIISVDELGQPAELE